MSIVRPSLWERIRSAVITPALTSLAPAAFAPLSERDSQLNKEVADRLDMSTLRRHRLQRAPHIVILTSELGHGHVRAAEALRLAVLEQYPGARVTLLDWWTLLDRDVARLVKEMYLQIVQHHSRMYEELYQLDQRTWRDIVAGKTSLPLSCMRLLALIEKLYVQLSPALEPSARRRQSVDRRVFGLLCTAGTESGTAAGVSLAVGLRARLALVKWSWSRLIRRLGFIIEKLHPDAVISTQMIPAALMAQVKKRRHFDIPSVAVPTDFGVHDFWREAETDLYCVGHSMLAMLPWLKEPRRLSATGFALMPEFRAQITQTQARQRFGLELTTPVLLVLGGGLGLNVDAVTEQLLQADLGAHLLVLSGHNMPARMRLRKLAKQYPGQLTLLEWTDHVMPYLRAADIVIGKPGGMSVAETLACGRPFLAMRSLGGQEGFNVRFLESVGVGRLLGDDELITQVRCLLHNPIELELLKTRAAAHMRCDGAQRIAAHVLSLLGGAADRQQTELRWQGHDGRSR